MKLGIFGGTFNPPHMGHISSMQTVQKKLGLGQVLMIPAFKNPLKIETEGPSPQQRLQMCELAVRGWQPILNVNPIEINAGGTSFTVDTLTTLSSQHSEDDLYLIIGMDQLEDFSKWKSWQKIITLANVVITSRPGYHLPTSVDQLPSFLQSEVEDFEFNTISLKSGKSIELIQLPDMEISSSQLRKMIRSNKNVQKYLPLSVESYIRDNKLYSGVNASVRDYKKFTFFCAQILNDKKAINIKCYDLKKSDAIAEYAIVTSGTSTRHTSALAENLIKSVKEEFNFYPQNIEGLGEGRWVILDYGQLMVHLFYDFVRQEYSIEKIWRDHVELPSS
jgi:nicotinate-nucleotide adenylyltransferase